MTKRILSFMIVLAMVLSLLPVHMVVGAEEMDMPHGHSDAHTCSEQCSGGTVTWTPWGVTNGSASTFPTASGHYYLECDITLTARNDIPAGQDVTVCLNGWNITETGSANVSYVSGKLTISDCTAYYEGETYVSGAVTGCKSTDGGCFNVRRGGGMLVLESGKLTGSTASGGGGAVSLQSTSGSSKGGVFHMYGGEITGCSAVNGGAVVANSGGSIYIHGGKISGNAATGTSTNQGGGAIYLTGASKLEVTGGEINGNTAKQNKNGVTTTGIHVNGTSAQVTVSGAPVIDSVYYDNASNAGLQVAGLKTGTQIVVTSVDKTLTADKLVKLAEDATQEGWDSGWITVNDQAVSMKDGGFVSGEIAGAVRHNHSGAHTCSEQCSGGTVTWTPWGVTNGSASTFPTASGHYYLECDLSLTARNDIPAGQDVTVCLNGWNITETGSGNVSYVSGKLTISDCTAYYEGDTYVSGAVTGCSASDGGCFNVRRGGGTLVLESGKLTNNTASGGGGAVSLQSTSGSSLGGVFHMYGGEITGNSAVSGGGIVSNNGGSMYIHGGRIENNTDKNGGSAIYVVGANSRLTVSGRPRINQIYFDNASNPGLQVAGLEAGTRIVATSKDKTLTADKLVKLAEGASQTDWDTGWITLNGEIVSLGEEGFVSGELVPAVKHTHCADGKTDCGHEQVGWTKWDSTNSLPTAAGNYYLESDVVLTGRWNVTTNINLCLNGHTIKQNTASQRVIKVYDGAKLTVTSCADGAKLIGGTGVGTGGGAIWVEDATSAASAKGTRLNLYNITVTGGTTGYGGGIYILNNAEAVLTNVTVENCTAKQSGGGVSVRENAKLTMTGCTVSGNTTGGDGGGMYAHKGTKITVTDTDFTGNTATGAGGGFGFGSSATGTLTNVTASGNSTDNGGGLIVQGSAQVTASKLTVKDNTADIHGGAVYVNSGCVLTLENSEITGNKATKNGGIYTAANATLSIVSTQITGNEAASGGGVYVGKDTAISLEGKTVIRGNQGGNLVLNGVKAQVKNLQEGTSVSVTTGRGAFTQSCEDYSDYFTSDSQYQMVEYAEGALHMVTAGEFYHKHCLCEGYLSNRCDHENIEWDVWDKTDSLPASGCYYLLNDVVLKDEQSISSDLTLCLNGHTVTAAENKRILSTPKNTTVTISISDCKGTGLLTGGVDVANETGGGAIFIRAGGTLDLYGGKIAGNKSITAGGGILLAANSVFNMYGGEISDNGARDEGKFIDGAGVYAIGGEQNIYGGKIINNRANNGGGIYSGGKLTVSGGLIEGNTAAGQGGGVLSTGTLTITGGQIVNNTAQKDGGGAYGRGKQALISGGTISGNVSKTSGGGVGFSKKAQVTVTGGTISGNTAGNGGGMIVQGGAALELQGGTITGNRSTVSGAGIFVYTDSSINMTGGTVSNNTAAANGGGIYVIEGTAKLSGGTVSGNSSVKDGGGAYFRTTSVEISGEILFTGNSTKGAGGAVCFSRESTGKITGGTYQKSTAVNAGAIVIQGSSKVEMSGMTIKNNTAENTGGAVYVNNATLTMSGGTVSGNTAVKGNTGGIYMDGETSVVKITGGSITYNTSKKDGAGIYNKKGTLTLSGMYIAGNKTQGAGGGFGASKKGKVVMYSGTVTGNEAPNGGGIIIQGEAHMDMYGGTISGNKATNTGGGLYVHKSSASIYGGTFKENHAVKNGGGAYFWRSTIKAENASFCDNYSGTGGGGFVVYWSKFEGTKLLSSGNTCDSSGGGVLLTKISEINFTDSIVENNTGTNAGGVLIQTWTTGTVSGLIIRNNQATNGWGGGLGQYTCTDIDYYDCEIYGNSATTKGGGVHMESARGANTPLAYADFTNVKVYNNTAGTYGGGVSAFRQIIYSLNDCQIFDNKAVETGGGLANRDGAIGTFRNLEVTGNESGKTGSGIWISDNTDMHNVTVTGNKTAEGSAVYYTDSDFDGQSYVLGLHKMSGNIRICDNEGTMDDLYIGEKTTIAVKAEGLGEETKIQVQLHSGILTNTLLGSYNYEGGDLHYTVTYGDRSIKEPEYEEPTVQEGQEKEQSTAANDIWLYVGIGAVALAVIGAAAALVLKKKKPQEADKK